MQKEMKYFIPNETFDDAIKNEEKGVLKALLIGIIGADPTFVTTEYKEAAAYVRWKSKEMKGSIIELSESYSLQEDEYTKVQEEWDEEYYQMLLVWYRDNYAHERLENIRKVGREVYRGKPTLGKAKRRNQERIQKEDKQNTKDIQLQKKASVVMATGNDARETRLSVTTEGKQNWIWIAIIVIIIIAIIAMRVSIF